MALCTTSKRPTLRGQGSKAHDDAAMTLAEHAQGSDGEALGVQATARVSRRHPRSRPATRAS
eukprot:1369231-Rhodomonas_salina.1